MGLILLSACGGSGGGAMDSPTTDPAPGRDPNVVQPGDDRTGEFFRTPEYFASRGLQIINAAAGYGVTTAGLEGGEGARIAIVDSGVDLHDDLNISNRFALTGTDFDDPAPHGTHVAGIAAAKRDGNGMHGVAFNADIVSLKIAPRDFNNANQLEDDSIIASAIASAGGAQLTFVRPNGDPLSSDTDAESDVLNMSFGTSDPNNQVLSAMIAAADNGKIMVAALGNDALAGPIAAPAIYVTDRRLNGLALAVGALDSTGNVDTDFSNLCGRVADYCLFAPGEAIFSTLPGNDYGLISGTSMSSPHVAGAVATLLAAFPSKSPQDIVQRMLTTADDLGRPGVDSSFGHGRLNLGAALSPVGLTSIPMADRDLPVDLNDGEAIIEAPAWIADEALDEALSSVLVMDEQGFPFSADLAHRIEKIEPFSPLSTFVSMSETESAGDRLHQRVDARIWQVSQDDTVGRKEAWQAGLRGQSGHEPGYRLTFDVTDQARLELQSGFKLGLENRGGEAEFNHLWQQAQFSSLALDDRDGQSMSVSWRLDETWQISSALARADDNAAYGGQLGLAYKASPHLTIEAATGLVDEPSSSFGLKAGKLSGDHGLLSSQSSLRARYDLPADVSVFAGLGYAHGLQDKTQRAGLIDELKQGNAMSAMVGMSKTDLMGDDELSFALVQPFRPNGARARLDIPGTELADGSVTRNRTNVDLDPDGRQTDWLVTYSKAMIDRRLHGSLLGFVQLQPGHDREAEPVLGAAARIHWSF